MKRYLRAVCDSVKDINWVKTEARADTEMGVAAQQLVIQTFSELFRFEHPERKWPNGGLIDISSEISEGAKSYAWIERETIGEAEIVADNADDLPMADVEGRNNVRGIKTLGIAIKYSSQDVRTARFEGVSDIVNDKVTAAKEGHDLKLDRLIRSGDPIAGLDGIANQPGIIVLPALVGSWASATPAQIIEDFRLAHNIIVDGSDGIEIPNTALFPVAIWTDILTKPRSTTGDSNSTVLTFLRAAFPNISRWDFDPGLRSAGTGGTPAALIYRKDRSRVRAVMPMMMTPRPPQERGLNFVINFESRFGGVMAPRPRSILRLEGI